MGLARLEVGGGSQTSATRASVQDKQLSMNDLNEANNKYAGYTFLFGFLIYTVSSGNILIFKNIPDSRWSKKYSKSV